MRNALLVLVVVICPLTAAPPADPTLLLKWPSTAADREQIFEGGQFLGLTPAPVVGTGPFSVSVWVNPSDLAGGNADYGRGIVRSTRDGQIGDWLLSVHPNGRVRFCNWRKAVDDPQGGHITKKSLVGVDSWHHIVAVWDGKANHLYVNGVKAEYDSVATAAGWGVAHEVGRGWTDAGYHWDGLIDNLRVYRRALTLAEIGKEARPETRITENPLLKPSGDPKVSQALDRIIGATLKKNSIEPAPAVDDAGFHRRVVLDLAGRIPLPAETEAFLADKSPDKRTKLVETLLAGKEMPMAWAPVLAKWVMPPENKRDPQFLGYLRAGLTKNKTWDRFARELLLARPEKPGELPVNHFLNARKAALNDRSIAKDVGRAFFGVNLRCAQCHDHPQVKEWTQERFFGLSAFFSRTFEHAWTEAPNVKKTAFGERMTGELEYTVEGKKKVAPLMFLDGSLVAEPPGTKTVKETPASPAAPPPTPAFSRREALVRVALSPKSRYFKRAMVNRVWQRLMGRGLVEPVDMMHDENPATHPELLDLLADDFAANGFDLRRLLAVIVQSETYARSSRWTGTGDAPKETLYAVAVLRPLDAEQLALSLPLATGYYDAQLSGKGKRAVAQVRNVTAWQDVVTQFDSNNEEFEPTATQALFLTNSAYVQEYFVAKSNLAQSLSALTDDARVAQRVYLSILSRSPTADEVMMVSRYLRERGSKSRVEACRELVWALISGAEFRFNH